MKPALLFDAVIARHEELRAMANMAEANIAELNRIDPEANDSPLRGLARGLHTDMARIEQMHPWVRTATRP